MTELDCLPASKPLQGGFPKPSKKHDASAASPGERLGTDGDPRGECGAFAHKEYPEERTRETVAACFAREVRE